MNIKRSIIIPACVCVFVALIFVFLNIISKRPEPICSDKYKQVDNLRVYYTDNVIQRDIDSLIQDFDLDTDSYFRSDIYIKLDKSDVSDYYVYYYVSDYVFDSETQIMYYQSLADDFSLNAFYPNKVTIYLCNKKFEPKISLTSKYPAEEYDTHDYGIE